MLNYSKKILAAVSFDKDLFKKEYLKHSAWLTQEELRILFAWCVVTFDYELLVKTELLF